MATRHPDCDILESLLGPEWACAGDYDDTDGIGVTYNQSDRLFSIEIDPDGIGFTVRDEESEIHAAALILTLDNVANILRAAVTAPTHTPGT